MRPSPKHKRDTTPLASVIDKVKRRAKATAKRAAPAARTKRGHQTPPAPPVDHTPSAEPALHVEPAIALPQITIILHRSVADALRAGQVHAGAMMVGLTPRILAALTPEEREILAALDVDAAAERVQIRFAKLHGLPNDGTVPFHADTITEQSTIDALHAAFACEKAHREELATELRARFADFTDAHGQIVNVEPDLPSLLASRPGPRHPALAELDAYAAERLARRTHRVHCRSRDEASGARRGRTAELIVPAFERGGCP